MRTEKAKMRREILFFSFSCTYRHHNSDQVSKRMNHHQNRMRLAFCKNKNVVFPSAKDRRNDVR